MTFVKRVIGATALDAATYEDVEADPSSTGQAMGVVLMSAAAAGIGALGFGGPLSVVPTITIIALLTWVAWVVLVYEVGVTLLRTPGTHADVTELLRTIGFASAPGLFSALGVIPSLAAPVFGVTAIWMFLAMMVAIRQALDYTSTMRALAVCAVGWMLALLFALVLGLVASPPLS